MNPGCIDGCLPDLFQDSTSKCGEKAVELGIADSIRCKIKAG